MYKSIYLKPVYEQIPKILSMLDRESISKTSGSFDRVFWSWKFSDFESSRLHEGLFSLCWIYKSNFKGNKYFYNINVLEWIKSGFKYWISLQNADGSFNEAYPNEKSLAATSFCCYYVGEAFLLIQDLLNDSLIIQLKNTFEKSGKWLMKNDETHGFLSNHLAVASLSLLIIDKIHKNNKFSERSNYFVNKIIKHQSKEGFYIEYDGMDIGYQSHCLFYLSRIWQITLNKKLRLSMIKSIEFFSHFIHVNGTLGGEYCSRNTTFYFPAGFEILSKISSTSRKIANFMRNHLNTDVNINLNTIDIYNYFPLLNNYIFSYINFSNPLTKKYTLPFQINGTKKFKDAGIFIKITDNYQAYFSPFKGGVLKAFNKNNNKLEINDNGYWIELNQNKSASNLFYNKKNEYNFNVDSCLVKANFTYVNQQIMTGWKFILFRILNLSFCNIKFFSHLLKLIIVKVLITKQKKIDLILSRKVLFKNDKIIINDQFLNKEKYEKYNFFTEGKFSTIHMGSTKYFQHDDLDCKIKKKVCLENQIRVWNVK